MPPTGIPSDAGERAGAPPVPPARRWLAGGLLAALAVGVASAGDAWYARPVGRARLVGVDYRATVRGGTCRTTWRALWCTSLPVGGQPRALTPAVLAAFRDQAMFELNPLTRRVRWAHHAREVDDSLRWRAVVDSARRALDARHLAGLPCDTADAHVPIAGAWRAGSEEVRLDAAWVHARAPARVPAPVQARTHPRPPRGYVVLRLVPYGAPGCGRDVPERQYVLLTPAEVARRAVDWLTGGGGE